MQGNGGGWYYILPSGALYAWSGSGLNGTLIAQLDPSYNANPSLLVNAQPGQGQATASTNGSSLTITPSPGFTGVLFVTASASDGYNTASRTDVSQLTVAAPTLPTGSATAAFGEVGYDDAEGAGWARTGRRATTSCSAAASEPARPATPSPSPCRGNLYLDDELHRPSALRALRCGSGRIAAAWYSALQLHRGGEPGRQPIAYGLELYLLDWDNKGRSEKVQISDAKTGASACWRPRRRRRFQGGPTWTSRSAAMS